MLLVDDDQAVRRSISLLLRARGFSVHDFGSAAELLADRACALSHCLITDYSMPLMDGLTLLARLRESGWPGTAILITGRYQNDLEKRALEAGFSALVEKPLTDEKLVGLIAQCLDKPPLQGGYRPAS
ncbi:MULTISPECIES: response regulator [Novosphingobium]|uniref:Response regulator n=1 Tax=Novosphingobium mangrovi (ex Huang et al. 2023) TaxID=2976432 RepID=A0ABT2I7X7_9SPHN|nr:MULTISPECIES: response regulator [Novosphingobium]MCT2400912.1 response regulator [Novosphingobium mangrovi (ex Huang et al. 2023)]CCA93206.1 response regulator receiver protein [Novosphingobium sp. PP1Y]